MAFSRPRLNRLTPWVEVGGKIKAQDALEYLASISSNLRPSRRPRCTPAPDRGQDATVSTTANDDILLLQLEEAREGDAEVLGLALESCRDYLLLDRRPRARRRADRQGRGVGPRAGNAPGSVPRLRSVSRAFARRTGGLALQDPCRTTWRSFGGVIEARGSGSSRSKSRSASLPTGTLTSDYRATRRHPASMRHGRSKPRP